MHANTGSEILWKKFSEWQLSAIFSASEVIRHTCAIQIRLLLLLLLIFPEVTFVAKSTAGMPING